jgi:hypothetical protein
MILGMGKTKIEEKRVDYLGEAGKPLGSASMGPGVTRPQKVLLTPCPWVRIPEPTHGIGTT